MAEGSSYQMESAAKKADHSEPGEIQKGCKRRNCNENGESNTDFDLEDNKKKKKTRKGNENGKGRSFFDCNICLDMAREPVVTLCGHLFCWVCFYKLRFVNSTSNSKKECPVCRGEVTDSSIIPIYGNEIENYESEDGTSGLMFIPPRPKGQRTERVVELVRQQPVPDPVAGEPLQAEARGGRINFRDLDEILIREDRSRWDDIIQLVDRSTIPRRLHFGL